MKIVKYVGIFSVFLLAAFGGLVLLSPSELEYTVNKDINAPLEKCWRTATDIHQAPNWISGLTSVKQTKGNTLTTGATYDMNYGEEDNSMVMKQKVTVLTPSEQITFLGTVENLVTKNSSTTFKFVDSTTTRLSTKVKMKALSYKMKLFMNNEKSFKNAEAENLNQLQAYIEKN